MKKLQVFPVTALVIASVFAFAFKTPSVHSLSGERWYLYQGGDINTPANYLPTAHNGMDDPGCNSSTKRCAVFVLPDVSNPDQPDQTSLTNVSGSNIRHKP